MHVYTANYNPNKQQAIKFNFEQFSKLKEVFDDIETGLVEKTTIIGHPGRKKQLPVRSINEMEYIANCQMKLKALKKTMTKMATMFGQLNMQLEEVSTSSLVKTEVPLIQIADQQQSTAAQSFFSMRQLLKSVAKPADGTINLSALPSNNDQDKWSETTP